MENPRKHDTSPKSEFVSWAEQDEMETMSTAMTTSCVRGYRRWDALVSKVLGTERYIHGLPLGSD